MQKNLGRKGIVLGIILLFVGASVIPSVVGYDNDVQKIEYKLNKDETFNEKNDDYNNLIKQIIESGVISNNDWLEQDKLFSSDGAANDYFDCFVSTSGSYAIIGALCDDDNGENSGSAYMFGGGPCCFTAGKKIKMADGSYKNIEDIEMGDWVKSYNVKTGKTAKWMIRMLVNPLNTVCEINDQLDQQNTEDTGGTFVTAGGKIAQSFTPSLNVLTRVKLLIWRVGNPTSDLVVSIRNSLTGIDLTSKSVPSSNIPRSKTWYEFDFSDIPVNTGHYIIYHAGNDFSTGNAIVWQFSDNNKYPAGESWFNFGSGWSPNSDPDEDFCFKTYGLDNQPPNPPNNPDPPDEANDISINADLSWSCSDPDGDPLTYDVYFEANDPTPDQLVSSGQSNTYYNPPGQMNPNTQYYWKIIAYDRYDSTNGPIWDFTTGSEPNDPPNPPSDPNPEDGATDVPIANLTLIWSGGDPDVGDILQYDVYFGDIPNPPFFIGILGVPYNQTPIEFELYKHYELEYDTTYFWKIKAWDNHAASTEGPIWSFTTEEEPIPDLGCSGTLSWTDVTPGDTVSGSITVENIGDIDSLLDWQIDSYPDWGTFTFDPDGGTSLPMGAPVTVDVEVVAPDDPEEEFEGEIVLVNSEDPDDTCIIDVALATPVSQQVINPLLQMILERFPNAFPILRHLMGL